MFSGIVSAVGTISESRPTSQGREITIGCDEAWLADAVSGESIAVNGACQTVTNISRAGFTVFASMETLACTNLGQLAIGRRVNLERSLRFNGRIDGHVTSGHVDARTQISSFVRTGNVIEFSIELKPDLAPMVAAKGSLAVDGISLTVHAVQGNQARFVIIPESLLRTTVSEWRAGREVNIEVDLFARYLARWLECRTMQKDARLVDVLDAGGFGPGIRRED